MGLEIRKMFLYPNTIFFNEHPHLVTTVLGTCVSVCIYDFALKIGGINHYMLPIWDGKGLPSLKYGNIAIAKLVDNMIEEGSEKKNLVSKVFGGWIKENEEAFLTGKRNILIAKKVLEEKNIPIIVENVGGKMGRLIKFNTGSGEVFLKYIKDCNKRHLDG